MNNLKVFSLGGSKNIGYYAAIRLLEKGATVTFLLRNPKCFDGDATIQKYVQSGKARLVQGDTLNEEQVSRGWIEAGKGDRPGAVDVVLFTIGGTPTMTLKGAALTIPDICERSMLSLIHTTPTALRGAGAQQPRFVVVSSMGITAQSHRELPLTLRVIYPWLLSGPHADKLQLERVVAHAGGLSWWDAQTDGGPIADDKIALGELGEITIIRPALLTDGACKGVYQTGGAGYYRVSRQHVAHFIVEKVLVDWPTYKGRATAIGY